MLVPRSLPDIRDPYFVEIVRGAEELANQRGYLTVLCNTNREPEKERSYVQTLRALRAGVILIGGGIDREAHLQDLAIHPAPVVAIGRHELPCSSVLIDDVRGAMDATTHLISLGRRRIAFVGGPSNSSANREIYWNIQYVGSQGRFRAASCSWRTRGAPPDVERPGCLPPDSGPASLP